MTMYRLPSFSGVTVAMAAAFLAAAAPSRAARVDAPPQSPTPQAAPPSAEGKVERSVEIIAFPDLVDATRKSPTASEARRPRLPRRNDEAPSDGGRRIPIKVHVPTSGGPYPVIVLSHGAGGSWDTHYAQAQDLASHGYAVLCVEHVGSNRGRLTRGLRRRQNVLCLE